MNSGGRLAGKVALVTGAAGGLGAALTGRFLAEGARVAAVDLDSNRLDALARRHGPDASITCAAVDVTSESSVAAMAQEVEQRLGGIDVLVNGAGIFPVEPFETMTYDAWRRVMAVNLDGVFLVTRAVVPALRRRGGGRIVNISSGTIWHGYRGLAHYASSKAALIGLTRSLAAELGDLGITVNAVTPALTTTEQARRTWGPEVFAIRREQRAIKRDQHAEDVTGVVVFLASDDGAFVTGQTINVDGGLTMR